MQTIRTPELANAAGALSRLIKAADACQANVDQGRLLVGASNGLCRVVKTDLDRRLAAGKLREEEAKLVEASANEASPLSLPSANDAVTLLRTAADMLERDKAA